MSGESKRKRGSTSLLSGIATTIRQRSRVRLYFILGFAFLFVEVFLALKCYRIVTQYDSLSTSLQERQLQHQIHQTKSSSNNDRNSTKNRPPDGRFNGFPVFYHDLTLNKSYHSRPYSSTRCVGENYQGEDFAWMHRSCHFRFLCFNVSSREFEVYARPDDEILQSIASHRHPFIDLSASVLPPPRNQNHKDTGDGVSLASGTVRHSRDKDDDKVGNRDSSRRQIKAANNWFPTVIQSSPPERYYALDEDVVFVPFHTLLQEKGERGKEYSVLWDDLLPIYTILNMFQLVPPDNQKDILLMRYINETEIRADCNQSHLQQKMNLFRPLMMRRGSNDDENVYLNNRNPLETTSWTTQIDSTLTSTSNSPIVSQLVCAKDGLAGLGPLGIRKAEGKHSVNLLPKYGKGNLLWMFRNYCLGNLGLLPSSLSSSVNDGNPKTGDVETPNCMIRIIFSAPAYSIASKDSGKTNTTQTRNDVQDFTPLEIGLRDFLSSPMRIQSKLGNDERDVLADNDHNRTVVSTNSSRIHIELHDFSQDIMNLTDRIELMMGTTVFIATCNEAAATAALFLPRGGSLIVFYETDNEDNGNYEINQEGKRIVANGRCTAKTSANLNCVDYQDLLNNLSHVRVQWLPMSTFHSKGDKTVLLYDLIKHGLKVSRKRDNQKQERNEFIKQ